MEDAAALFKIIHELAAELHPRRAQRRPVTLDSSLSRDVGLDSLARVELLARVEKQFQVTIPERLFAQAETPRDLLRALRNAGPTPMAAVEAEVITELSEEAPPAPYTARTLVDVVDWHILNHPERPHIRFIGEEGEEGVMTYRQLLEGAEAVAAGLQHHGLLPGKPVSIMLPTGREYFFSFLGILLAGGIPVPIYPPARRSQVEDHLRRHSAILKNCGAQIMILVPEAKLIAQALRSQAEELEHLVTVKDLSSRRVVIKDRN